VLLDAPGEVNRLVFCFSREALEPTHVSNNLSGLVQKSIDSVLKTKDTSTSTSSSSSLKRGGEKSKKGKTNSSPSNSSVNFQGGLDDAQEISDSFKIYNKVNNSS